MTRRRWFRGVLPLWRWGSGLLLLLGVGTGCAPEGASNEVGAGSHIEELTPDVAARLIGEHQGDDGFVILDVRTPGEFREERIADAINIDFNSRGFRERLATLDRSATYFVYCRTGNRSGQSLRVFRELGFEEVRHLTQGITAWKSEGRPTVAR